MAKIDQKILKAIQLKGEIKELEKDSTVSRYLRLTEKRKSLHRDITKHLEQYPNTSEERPHLYTATSESLSIKYVREFFQKVGKKEITNLQDAVDFLKGKIKRTFYAYTK